MLDPNPLVLVADDEPLMRELVVDHLRSFDDPKLDVIAAEDGEQALRLARERLPDLVVLDVMMPEMSGWEVCKKIREDISLAHTGVLMLTGIGEKVNELTSPLYGADAYIDKPFQLVELEVKVKSALAARRSQREGVPRAETNGVIGTPRPVARKKADKPGPRKAVPRVAAKKRTATPAKKVAAQAATKKPVAKKPVAKKPVAKKPVAKKPVAKKPVAKKPVARKPAAKKKPAAAKKPAARGKSAARKKPAPKRRPRR